MLIKNYGLAVLDVPIWKITCASLAAGVPFSAAWAAVGVSSKNIAEILSGKMKMSDALPEENGGLLIAGTVIFAVGFAYVFRQFGKKFKEILDETNGKSQ